MGRVRIKNPQEYQIRRVSVNATAMTAAVELEGPLEVTDDVLGEMSQPTIIHRANAGDAPILFQVLATRVWKIIPASLHTAFIMDLLQAPDEPGPDFDAETFARIWLHLHRSAEGEL